MQTYIALLRGINVGGKHKLPMRELIKILETLDLHNIKTYIQSGNVVFQSEPSHGAGLADKISNAIDHTHHFKPKVYLLELDELTRAIAANPFPDAETEPKTLYVYFLETIPESPDLTSLETIKQDSERFQLQGKIFYQHSPLGIGKSKLPLRVDKALGVATTARNWRTVCQVAAIAQQSRQP